MSQRILGYVMARDAWPVIGLSIAHAISLGLENIVVVNHRSTDDTLSGLEKLKRIWPDRLTLINLDVDRFPQQLVTNVVMKLIGASAYDWVYVFDSDEFMLRVADESMSDTLQNIPSDVDVIRYELRQWIAPRDMNDLDISQYTRFTKRAIARDHTIKSGEILYEKLTSGEVNYFDIPFPSKVIVRGKHAHRLMAGAHGLAGADEVIEQAIPTNVMVCGHIPIRSKRQLGYKAKHGQRLIDEGLPREHGWQNQAIHAIARDGYLDEYWINHSIPKTPAPSSTGRQPRYVEDTSLTESIAVAIKSLELALSSAVLPQRSDMNATRFPLGIELGPVISEIRSLNQARRLQLETYEEMLLQQRMELEQQKMAVQKLEATVHRVSQHNEQLARTVVQLKSSSSWRLTAPARQISTKLRTVATKLRELID